MEEICRDKYVHICRTIYVRNLFVFSIYDETGDNLKVSVRRPRTNECLALAQDKKPNGPEVRGKK